MFIVVKKTGSGGFLEHSIPPNRHGEHELFHYMSNAATHLVWLEAKEPLENEPNREFQIYKLEPQDAAVSIAGARKRAGIAAPKFEPVSRAVYEDLLGQFQNRGVEIQDLTREIGLCKAELKAKAICLDEEFDRMDRIQEITKEE